MLKSFLRKVQFLKILVIIYSTALLFSCEKKLIPPTLDINQHEFYLNDSILSGEFIVKNTGDGILKWIIEKEHDYILIPSYEGYTRTNNDTVRFSITPLIEPGVYDFYIRVNSDGDAQSVRLYITIADRAGIIPGKGTHHISLNQSYADLRSVYGNANNFDVLRFGDNNSSLIETYYDKYGIGFLMHNYNTPILDNHDKITSIILYPPFAEKTKEGITTLSTYSDVIATYGKPDELSRISIIAYNFNVYVYYSLGIAFYFFENDYDKMYYIEIFEPNTPTKLVENSYCKRIKSRNPSNSMLLHQVFSN